MVQTALALYADSRPQSLLAQPLYAMDSTVVDLCLKLFPWAHYRSTKAAIKAHTVLDLHGAIPVMMTITTGNVADVKLLDTLQLPDYSLVVLDRGYIDYARLYALTQRKCSFVVRAKSNLQFRCLHAFDFDRRLGVRSDQVIEFSADKARGDYPQALRRVRYIDAPTCVEYVYLSDRFDLDAMSIVQIYRQRWQIELFFKWLKQNLNIAHFFGNSENAVKSQVWIAVCVYLAAVLAHKTLRLPVSLHTMLQIVEVNLLDKTPIAQLVAQATEPATTSIQQTQKCLF
jgi:transposase